MNLHDLEAFLAISEEGSITKAAQKLHISQPALTRQLKALEEEFGVQLAVRGSRQTDLTKAGRLLRHRAQEMLQLAEKTKKELKFLMKEIFMNIIIIYQWKKYQMQKVIKLKDIWLMFY